MVSISADLVPTSPPRSLHGTTRTTEIADLATLYDRGVSACLLSRRADPVIERYVEAELLPRDVERRVQVVALAPALADLLTPASGAPAPAPSSRTSASSSRPTVRQLNRPSSAVRCA